MSHLKKLASFGIDFLFLSFPLKTHKNENHFNEQKFSRKLQSCEMQNHKTFVSEACSLLVPRSIYWPQQFLKQRMLLKHSGMLGFWSQHNAVAALHLLKKHCSFVSEEETIKEQHLLRCTCWQASINSLQWSHECTGNWWENSTFLCSGSGFSTSYFLVLVQMLVNW